MGSWIKQWLEDLSLGKYADTFAENRVDIDLLPDLTGDDLKDMGIHAVGDRRKILRAISSLSKDVADAAPATAQQGMLPRDSVTAANVERRQLTVVFVDLVGSTELSANLDPEETRDLLRQYQETVAAAIRRHGGYVANYLGDGVLAYFGWPQADEDQAIRAAQAGLVIVDDVQKIAPSSAGTQPLAVRIGIATGLVVVGDLESNISPQNDVISGETPNLAARLQAAAGANEVYVNESTYRLLGNEFSFDRIGRTTFKGFAQPMDVWRVKGVRAIPSRFEARQRGLLTPFVGREDEVALLHQRWADASKGAGQVVLVTGEPGIGKSRIVRDFRAFAAGEPDTIRLSYQCSPHQRGSALHPIIAQITFAAGLEANDAPGEKLDKLERLFSAAASLTPSDLRIIAQLFSIPTDDRYGGIDLPPERSKHRMLELLLDQVLGLARLATVLIVFEDLQWIDPTSQELLDLFVERINETSALLLCTYRTEYVTSWLEMPHVTELRLSHLDTRQTTSMIERLTRDSAMPPSVVRAIVARTDGIPLFIEELTQSILESGILELRSGSYELVRSLDDASLPSTLQASLMARLDRLSEAKETVQLAATIGRNFDYPLLKAVSGQSDGSLSASLDRLAQSQLIFQYGSPPTATYMFKHALVQETAYESLLHSRRIKLHALVARTLEQQFPKIAATNPGILAHHYIQARMPAQAIDQLRRAASEATAHSANLEAIGHLHQAIKQTEKLDDPKVQVESEIGLREMLCVPLEAQSWVSNEIEENLNKLQQLRERRGDREELFAVLQGRCGRYHIRGEMARARAVARDMSSLATQSGDLSLHVLSERALGMCLFFSGQVREATGHFMAALELYHRSDSGRLLQSYVANPRLVSLGMLAWSYLLLNDDEHANEMIEATLAEVREERHIYSVIYAHAIVASCYQTSGQADRARQYATTALRQSRENYFDYWEAWSLIVRGWARAALGEREDGIVELETGISKYIETGAGLILPYGKTLLADALYRAGREGDAREVLAQLAVDDAQNEVRFYETETKSLALRLLPDTVKF